MQVAGARAPQAELPVQPWLLPETRAGPPVRLALALKALRLAKVAMALVLRAPWGLLVLVPQPWAPGARGHLPQEPTDQLGLPVFPHRDKDCLGGQALLLVQRLLAALPPLVFWARRWRLALQPAVLFPLRPPGILLQRLHARVRRGWPAGPARMAKVKMMMMMMTTQPIMTPPMTSWPVERAISTPPIRDGGHMV